MSDLHALTTVEFEELPLLTQTRRTGVVHGMLANCAAEVSFYDDGTWWISRIWMEAFTGNSMATVPTDGIEIKEMEGVNIRTHLWELVHGALVRHRTARIDDAVRLAIDDGAFREVEDDRTDYAVPALIPTGAVTYPERFEMEAA